MANEKRTSCGLLVNWDDTPPADLPGATWKAIGLSQSVTPPSHTREEIDVSDVGECYQRMKPGRAAATEFTFVHYEDLASAETIALLAAWTNGTRAAFQVKYPYETEKYNKSFFGYVINYSPGPLDQNSATLADVTIRVDGDIVIDQDTP